MPETFKKIIQMKVFFQRASILGVLFFSLGILPLPVASMTFEYLRQLPLNKKWIEIGKTEEESIKGLLTLLGKSQTGRKIIQDVQKKAKSQGKTILDIISAGSKSLTDTVLVRRYSPRNPHHVVYESHSTVKVNWYHSIKDGLLDLAHELTHYAYREGFNPYKKNYNVVMFIKDTIEGTGGEVEAYVKECQVFRELFYGQNHHKDHCEKVYDAQKEAYSVQKVTEDFYRMGHFVKSFFNEVYKFQPQEKVTSQALKNPLKVFPHLTSQNPLFISSVYELPYPLAAVIEYKTVLKKVCENDFKRVKHIEELLNNYSHQLKKSPKYKLTQSWSEKKMKYEKIKDHYISKCQYI